MSLVKQFIVCYDTCMNTDQTLLIGQNSDDSLDYHNHFESQDTNNNVSQPYVRSEEQEELYTARIQGARRLFFVDLKQSHQGKYLKITEKSGGQKHTILMDSEDVDQFFKAITDIHDLLLLDKSEK